LNVLLNVFVVVGNGVRSSCKRSC